MINVSALCEWTRIGRFGLHRRRDIIASGDGLLATSTTCDEHGNESLNTVTYSKEDLLNAVKESRFATSDDILYLISPWDIIEVSTSPDGKTRTNPVRTNAEPPEDGDLSTFHEEIAKLYADPSTSGYPQGSYATAIFAPPGEDPEEPLRMLAHREGPDSEWVVGPRIPSKRKAGSMTEDLDDPPWSTKKYTF